MRKLKTLSERQAIIDADVFEKCGLIPDPNRKPNRQISHAYIFPVHYEVYRKQNVTYDKRKKTDEVKRASRAAKKRRYRGRQKRKRERRYKVLAKLF